MKYKLSILRTIATFFIFGIPIFIISAGASADMFIDIPSFVVTVGLSFFMMLAVYGVEFLKFIPHSLRVFLCEPLEPNPRLAQIALFGSRSIIGAGLIAMIIGSIQLLSNLADPSGFGWGMASGLVGPFYAIIVSEIFFAVVYQSFKDAKIKEEDNPALPLKYAGILFFVIFFSLVIFFVLMFSTMSYRQPDKTPTIQKINEFRKNCPQAAYWLDYDMEHMVTLQSDISLWMGNNGTIRFRSSPETYTVEKIIQHANLNGWKYHLSVKLTEEHFDAYRYESYLDDFTSEAYKAAQVIERLWCVRDFEDTGCTVLAFETGSFQGWASYVILSTDQSMMLVFFNDPHHPDTPHDFWVPEGLIELNQIQMEQVKELQ